MTTTAGTQKDVRLVTAILQRAASDLAMIIDRELVVGEISCERTTERSAALGKVHISFRQEYHIGDRTLQGCLIMPLPEAISIACYLMVMPDEAVKNRRNDTNLDRSTKDAMLELSNFVGGSADQVLRDWGGKKPASARSAGCQGVASGAIPNFRHGKDETLVIAYAKLSLHDYAAFDAVYMLPAELVGD